MTTYTPPAAPGDMTVPPLGPTIYAFERLWGAGGVTYIPRRAEEDETKQAERTAIVSPPGIPGGWDLDGDEWHFWEPMTLALRRKCTLIERRALLACVGLGRLWIMDENGIAYWTRARLMQPRNTLDVYDKHHGLSLIHISEPTRPY